MENNKEIKWAVLGCGVIANEMAVGLASVGRKIYAVGNRTHSKAVAFAEKYGVNKVYDDFREMFSDDEIDVIYITTPHNTHIKYMKEALANGKHILCEKSITLNSQELSEALKAAKQGNAILCEAMTIFHMPLYKKLEKIINGGELGDVRMITMNFGSYKEYDMANRFFNKQLAGGAMLDIGVYAISFARMFLKSCPDDVISQVKTAPTGVDEQATILMKNKEGQMVTVALSLHSKQPKRAMISCDKAYVEVMEYPRADKALITYTNDGHSEEIFEGKRADALIYEMEDMETCIRGKADLTRMEYTKDVMKIMTDVRHSWGFYYDEEKTN
jgi:predicted dehydrogenase